MPIASEHLLFPLRPPGSTPLSPPSPLTFVSDRLTVQFLLERDPQFLPQGLGLVEVSLVLLLVLDLSTHHRSNQPLVKRQMRERERKEKRRTFSLRPSKILMVVGKSLTRRAACAPPIKLRISIVTGEEEG